MTRSHKYTPRLKIDLIIWYEYLNVDPNIYPTLHQSILHIIYDNWDSFCEQEVSRPMFDFEFCFDRGDSKLVCCRQLACDIYEIRISVKKI